MIQVRFAEQSRSRLVLIWDEAEREPVAAVDANAANLLFSVLGDRQDKRAAADAQAAVMQVPTPAKAAVRRRRKPRVARNKPH